MSQLRALVGLRWRMVRSRRARVGLLSLVGVIALLGLVGVVVGQSLPPSVELFRLTLLAPTLLFVFVVLTVVAPLVAGGGNELYPEGQLVAYPIEPRAVFAGSVLIAPLNLAWITQLLVLLMLTGMVSERGPGVLLALTVMAAFVLASTVVGQALAWAVVGVRQRPAGRAAMRALGALLVLGSLVLFALGETRPVLDRSPTRQVIIGAVSGSQFEYGRWALTTGVLLLVALVAARSGARACAWAIRRTSHLGRPELAPVQRRAAKGSGLKELIAVDQASVWRSTSLRRGALVLAVLPGGVAMLAHPSWESLTLLPGLVGAGAGLLFGVNAFCLDGAGALWVSTLPHPPRHTFLSKLVVIAQTCLVSVVLAVGLAATQVRTRPSAAELLAVLGSVAGSTLLVVAACARLSVQRPHKADLRGPRDTPAPPTAMAVYSMRLALGTTWAGLAFAGAGASGSAVAALAAAVAVLCVALRSLHRTLGWWQDPALRSRVVTTVSYG